MTAGYYPDDSEKLDYLDVRTAQDLRPFLAHVLNQPGFDDLAFLDDLAKLAAEMRSDRAASNQPTLAQWLLLETARLEGAVDVDRHHRPTADGLAARGMVTLSPADDGWTTVTPVERLPR